MKLSDIKWYPVISFPIEWIYVYRTILLLLGNEEHCNCNCNKNNVAIDAYHSFIIAAAAYNVGKLKEAVEVFNGIKESISQYIDILQYPFTYTINGSTYVFYKDGSVDEISGGDNTGSEDSGNDNDNPGNIPDNPINTIDYIHYVGQINGKVEEFIKVPLSELLINSQKVIEKGTGLSYETKKQEYTLYSQVFYLLIPSTGKITELTYASASFDSDVIADGLLQERNDTININGINYKCYWHRIGGATSSNEVTYNYKIKFIYE